MRFSLAAPLPILTVFLLIFSQVTGSSQSNDQLVVSRIAALDQRSPIINIAFDENNTKWVANEKGVFEVRSAELTSPLKLAPGEQSAYLFPGGNADVRWLTDDMNKALGNILSNSNTISAAAYDAKKDELWIGTTASGLHLLKTKPTLSKVAISANNKLSSNHILHIFLDNQGQKWVGTKEGVLIGSDTRWRLEQKYFAIHRVIRDAKGSIWVAGEGEIWQVDSKERWLAIPINDLLSEGEVQDIALDGEGRLWIASESIVCYDPVTEEVRRFGPIEYYTSQFATCITVDLDGAVWIGTEDKGVFVIDKASALTVNIVMDKALSCAENIQDAAISVKVSGGTAPFTYRWDNDLQGEQLSDLGPGTYSVTVVDARQRSKSARITLEDTRLSASIKLQEPESAPGAADAVALALAKGGAPQFSYRWDNGENSNIARKLSAGKHSVTITDKNGCTAIASVTIEPKTAQLQASVQLAAPISCHEGNNGALEAGARGGKEPYSYQWKNNPEKTARITDLSAGEYEVTVTDAGGNSTAAIFVLVAPAPMNVNVNIVKVAGTNQSDGTATLSVEGGTPPYQYRWDNGETGQQASKLAAGQHKVSVSDARGCTALATLTISEDIQPLKASISQTAINTCADAATASLEAQVTGGKSPFSYQWNVAGRKEQLIGQLPAGAYSVTITDATGATATSSFSVSAPEKLVVNTTVVAAASTGMSDGVASALVSGGTGPYTYLWDNGENKAQASALSPGEHRVTITDKNACTAVGKVNISEDILPLFIELTQRGSNACADAASAGLSLQINGGKPPYRIQWGHTDEQATELNAVPAGDYTVLVSDASGGNAQAAITIKAPPALSASISLLSAASTDNTDGIALVTARGGTPPYNFMWDNGERSQQASRLGPGERSVTVTDAKSCAVSASISVAEDIQSLTASLNQEAPINCYGDASGVIAVTVKGGKKPFQYQWSQAGLSGDRASGLKAGSYSVEVRDAVGNTSKAELTLKDPAPLQAKANASAAASTSGRDGRAVVQLSGGTAPYSFAWDNGESTSDADSLAPGNHTVSVTDKNGCLATASVTIAENIQALRVVLSQEAQIACAGDATAAIAVSITGGKGPYTIQWSQPSLKGEQAGGLPAGSYAVTVSDVQGTQQVAEIQIKSAEPLVLSIGKRRGAMSASAKDGRATLTVSGGLAPYRYDWDSQETTAVAERLSPGMHTVSVTDAAGCIRTAQVEIPIRILPELSAGLLQTGQAVRMEQLQFDADSIVLKPDFYPLLDELYDFLDENPGVVVEIGGHTNSLPPDAVCDQLSSARAKAVAEYLIAKGILDKRVFHKGYGKRQPIATNTTPEGRKRNQRVEVKILQLQDE